MEDQLYPSNRKKSSLLKRTASEPRLNKLNSENDLTELEKAQENDTDVNSTSLLTKNTQIKISKTNNKNFNPNFFKDHDEETQFDSPYNELYFHNFENILIDYLKEKHK